MEIKITYQAAYDEASGIAHNFVLACRELPKCTQVKLLLMFLVEYSQMWHKTKCAANEYCVKQFADIANGYAAGVEALKQRLLDLMGV